MVSHGENEVRRIPRTRPQPFLHPRAEFGWQGTQTPHVVDVERPAEERSHVGQIDDLEADRGVEELPPERLGIEAPGLRRRARPPGQVLDHRIGEPRVAGEAGIDRLGRELLSDKAPAVDGVESLAVQASKHVLRDLLAVDVGHEHLDRPAPARRQWLPERQSQRQR